MGPAVSVSPAAATAADNQLAGDGAFGSQRSVEEEDVGGINSIQPEGSALRQTSSTELSSNSSNSSSISVTGPSHAVQHPEAALGSDVERLTDVLAAPDTIPDDAAGNGDDGDGDGDGIAAPMSSPPSFASSRLLTPGQLLQQVTAPNCQTGCLIKAHAAGLHWCLRCCEVCFTIRVLLGRQRE